MDDLRSVPPSVQLESTTCPLGCPPSDELFARGNDRIHGLPGEFRVVRCTRCGLARTDPRPTAETIGFYYPEDYEPYRYTRGAARAPARKQKKPLWRRIARSLVEFNSDRLPPCEKGHVLELGCASGAYLEYVAGLGFTAEGIEPNANAAAFAASRGFRVQATTIERMAPPERAPSLIVGWMVVEHLHEPIACLRKLHDWAAEGAQLAISVPDAGSRLARTSARAGHWYALHLPCHLFHFDSKSVSAVLASAGWDVTAIHHHRTLGDYVKTAAYRADDAGLHGVSERMQALANHRAFHLAAYPLGFAAGALGETGRMTVWARRV